MHLLDYLMLTVLGKYFLKDKKHRNVQVITVEVCVLLIPEYERSICLKENS
jgi:hypothetical protein